MGKRELSIISVVGILILFLVIYKARQTERQIKIDDTRKKLVEIGEQVKQYYNDDAFADLESLSLTPDSLLKSKSWDFTQKQPKWILLPKPDYDEQSDKGLNLRINPSQTITLSNNKEELNTNEIKVISFECGAIFEEVHVSFDLVNDKGEKFSSTEILTLKEGTSDLRLEKSPTFEGKVKELIFNIKNTNSRSISTFNIKKISLSPF